MKIKLPAICFLLLLSLSYLLFQPTPTSHKASLAVQAPQVAKVYAGKTAKTETVYAPPTHISIPNIGVDANVVSVGLTNKNAMDVPNNFVDAGWYNLGYKPGERGSVVLDGHSDDFHGNPAVFYYLDELEKGDKILITDASGKQFTYRVTDNQVYPVDALPMQQIFASTDAARLNIITCHGQWDDSIQTYNQRTVIYAVLATNS